MGYVTYTELTEWFTPDESQATVEKMIDWASSIVDSETGTRFESTSRTDTFIADGHTKTFYLEKTPVISVDSVTIIDDDGDTETSTVKYFMSQSGKVVIEDIASEGYRVQISYAYGDTDNLSLAKLATIYLTRLGLEMMKRGGGVFPEESLRIGDIEYRISKDSELRKVVMDVNDILNRLRKMRVYTPNRSDRYDSVRWF